MGRQAQAAEDDWDTADELETDGDLDADDVDEGDEPEPRAAHRTLARRPMARRLIEQARENRELSRRLADFDDYVV